MFKSTKSLILVIAILGVISALVTGYVKSDFGRNSSMMEVFVKDSSSGMRAENQPMIDGVLGTGKGSSAISEPAQVKTMMAQDSIAIAPMPPSYGYDEALDVENRVYQKSATYQVVVKDVDNYMRQIKEYTLSIEGRIMSSGQYSSQSPKYKTGYLTIKVPVAKFEESSARMIADVQKVFSESLSANDATGQYVNSQDTLNQLREQKAEKEIQLLQANNEVEKKRIELDIQRLNNQISNAEKNAKSVEGKIEYATITVAASDSESYFQGNLLSKPDFSYQLRMAWYSVMRWLLIIAVVAIWAAVYSILWLPLVLIIALFFRRRNKSVATDKK